MFFCVEIPATAAKRVQLHIYVTELSKLKTIYGLKGRLKKPEGLQMVKNKSVTREEKL